MRRFVYKVLAKVLLIRLEQGSTSKEKKEEKLPSHLCTFCQNNAGTLEETYKMDRSR